jgi:hypothetical protein
VNAGKDAVMVALDFICRHCERSEAIHLAKQ